MTVPATIGAATLDAACMVLAVVTSEVKTLAAQTSKRPTRSRRR